MAYHTSTKGPRSKVHGVWFRAPELFLEEFLEVKVTYFSTID
jgi:hypothetical protein